MKRLPGESGFEPPVKHQQFPLLDALRAIAAIAILIVHTALFTRSFDNPGYGRFLAHLDIGVPFFFLLSAFLLYRPFVAARVEGIPRTRLGGYARRRFLRIAPAYWLALTVAALLPGMAGALSGNWWVYYGLLQNYPIYTPTGTCATEALRCGIPPAWSLAIEVAFYAVLPLYALAMAGVMKRLRRRSWFAVELSTLFVLAAVSVWIQAIPPITHTRFWFFFSPLGRAWWFGLGMALAVVSVWVAQRDPEPRGLGWIRRRPGAFILGAAGLYALSCILILNPTPTLAFPVDGEIRNVVQYLLFGVIAAFVLIPAVLGQDGGGLYRRTLGHPALAWLGLVSYGIFLWQFPVMITLFDAGVTDIWRPAAFPIFTITALAGTIVCAALSYYLLERPLMRRGRRRPRR